MKPHRIPYQTPIKIFFVAWIVDCRKLHKISFKKLFYGAVNSCEISINQLLRFAISQHATAIVIAHNHPFGLPHPSRADLILTQQIQQACQLLELRLIDHCIISSEGNFSFAEQQLLKFEHT